MYIYGDTILTVNKDNNAKAFMCDRGAQHDIRAFCAMIAFAVYAGESTFYWKDYSASFALTIIAFILGLIIGILGILDYLGFTGGKVGAW
ncbi:hypothetical protein CHS0354_039764 [Potamilus streckersoni]|uniref:Uncharacterized protein n=1 Tax=Potamilus streckersoni TaxID=2493646 RepID=A0AAE0S029_9BIVA|nr:hypothetical protein CHS0354_039764 [Potamilus streckersoni]